MTKRRERFGEALPQLVAQEADDGPDDGYSWSDSTLEARIPELNPWAGGRGSGPAQPYRRGEL